MYIYNVTINIEAGIQEEWLKWMKETHIPDVMRTGCFVESRMVRVMNVEDEGHTYSVQYTFREMKDIERYQTEFAKKLQEDGKQRFGGKFVAFRTLLEIMG